MTQTPTSGPVVPVKAQPNVYTVLLIIAFLAMLGAAIYGYMDLNHSYGITFGDLFSAAKQ